MADDVVPSDTVLDEIPDRALKFLSAVSINTLIFALLATRGYDKQTHELGWQLFFKAVGYHVPNAATPTSPEATAASDELDAWDNENFRVISAAWLEFPEQNAFLFRNDLVAESGKASIVAVRTCLDRLDEIENGKDRKATRKVDQAAMAKLAKRGITPEVRKHLRGLIAIATGAPEVPDTSAADANATARREARIALWTHITEWSEIARVVVKRKDHLILLGLAKRKAPKKKDKKVEPKAGEGGDK